MSKVDQSGFQLDKKELLKDVPLMLKGIAGQVIDFINSLDANHDGKADLCQIAPIVFKALPLVVAIGPYVHIDKLVDWFVDHDFVQDKEAVRKILSEVLRLALEAAQQVAHK